MSILNDAFKPNREAAKEHIKLTIKYYSQLDEYKFEKQLEVAERGLYVAGFSKKQAYKIVQECLEEAGV